jgi:hypothetical protein
MSLRRAALVVLVLGAIAGCGDRGESATTASTTTTLAPPPPPTAPVGTTAPASTGGGPTMSTSAPVPITTGGSSTSGPVGPSTSTAASGPAPATTTATTSVDGPSTTTAPGTIILRANGLGQVLFGTDPDTVIAAMTSEVGAPWRDTGWMDPLSLGSCPGTQVRTVQFGDLSLYFGDESRVATGRPHFFAYSFGPAAAATPEPAGLTIDGGGTIGTTVAALRADHAGLQLYPADPTAPASFAVADGLTGQLTGTTDADTVTRVQGGIGCGE